MNEVGLEADMDQEQTSIQELPKDVMRAMELESYTNVEIPNGVVNLNSKDNPSTLRVQENNGSIFD